MCVLAFFSVSDKITVTRAEGTLPRTGKEVAAMKKDFGVKPYLYPMPAYMIGTYNEDDSVDVMMMA